MPRPRTDHCDLWERYRNTRSADDRNALVVAYLPLVEQIAAKVHRKLGPQTLFDVPSLVNAGVFGLIEAIDGFDPGRGCYFSTFAHMRIKGAILDELRRHDWVPRLERQRQKRVEARPAGVVSLRIEQDTDGEESPYGDWLVDRGPPPDARLNREDVWRDQLRGLSQRERLLVLLYFRDDATMKEIGRQVGCSESRVSQQMSAILRRLRHQAAKGPAPQRSAGAAWRPRPRVPPKPVVVSPLSAIVAPKPVIDVPSPAGRQKIISTYVTVTEKAAIQDAARGAGLTVASWIRQTVLAALPHSA